MHIRSLRNVTLALVFTCLSVPLLAETVSETGAGKSAFAAARKTRELVRRFGDSFVTVRYWTKRNERGESPRIGSPYRCPNCNNMHWNDAGDKPEKGIPAEFVGFVIAPDRVVIADLAIPAEFVKRIEIVTADATAVEASEFEWCPDDSAVILKSAKPIPGAKPFAFVEASAENASRHFYVVTENGLRFAGIKPSRMGEFKHCVEADRDIYEGIPATVILTDRDEPATIALNAFGELDDGRLVPPEKWRRLPIAARDEREQTLRRKLSAATLPVTIQLEANKEERRRRYWRSDDDSKNDFDASGILLGGNRVVVLQKLSAEQTARLAKLEATLPDGSRRELKFVESYADYGAFAARFDGDQLPDGLVPLELDRTPAAKLFLRQSVSFRFANQGGKFDFQPSRYRVTGLRRVTGNLVVPEFEREAGFRSSRDSNANCAALTDDGRLLGITLESRKEREFGDASFCAGTELVAFAERPAIDPECVPRKLEERKRTPWLGVEAQDAGEEIVRSKKALSYVERADSVPLVTSVASNSPAASLGIVAGDLLLSVAYVTGESETSFRVSSDFESSFDWNEVFDHPEFIEAGNSGRFMPWPNVESGINETLAQFGVGTEVRVAWVSDGVRKEGMTKLALAPVHFANAPRARNKDLGVTVCDMTEEVRKYFKFAAGDPGVVIAKIKSGGTAAVAGLRPLEIVTHVNGEGVKDAKDFVERTKSASEINLTVRRLSATRMVPIKAK